MQIAIGPDPVLFSLFGMEFRWYSMAIMLSIFVAVWFIAREFRRKGIDDSEYGNVVLIAVVSGILGARLFHIMDEAGHYLRNPAEMLDFQSGGLANYGAVGGGFIGVMVACCIYRLPALRVIDSIAPGLVLEEMATSNLIL